MKKIILFTLLSISSAVFADVSSTTIAALNESKSIKVNSESDSAICYSLGRLGLRLENISIAADTRYFADKSRFNEQAALTANENSRKRSELQEFCEQSANSGDRILLVVRLKEITEALSSFQEIYVERN